MKSNLIINEEEINRIKFLLEYKKGVVISEQTLPAMPYVKPGETFNAMFNPFNKQKSTPPIFPTSTGKDMSKSDKTIGASVEVTTTTTTVQQPSKREKQLNNYYTKNSANVKQIQTRLQGLGYSIGASKPDGILGKETLSSILNILNNDVKTKPVSSETPPTNNAQVTVQGNPQSAVTPPTAETPKPAAEAPPAETPKPVEKKTEVSAKNGL